MKRTLITATIAALLSAPTWAQQEPRAVGRPALQLAHGGFGPGGMMGPGMMGGYGWGGYGSGGYGMGPGMMGGMRGYGGPDLTSEQRAKTADVEQNLARKHWDAMSKMQEQQFQLHELYAAGKADDAALRKSYQAMAEAQKQMFEASLEARKRIDSVLTKEQREQLRRGWGWR